MSIIDLIAFIFGALAAFNGLLNYLQKKNPGVSLTEELIIALLVAAGTKLVLVALASLVFGLENLHHGLIALTAFIALRIWLSHLRRERGLTA